MNSISDILKKDHLKIIITDSGLGGLSVQAKLDRELRERKNDKKIELIYFNSFAGDGFGYNEVSDFSEKIGIFNSALTGMLSYNPDLILIACNTLSALYPQTELSKSSSIPVFGIIDLGVELILESIKNSERSKILLLGTETTIKSNQYQANLVSKGISSNRIITQVCKYLEDEIQIDPSGEKVYGLINKYIDEASLKLNLVDTEELFAVLCCTHYGYSKNVFLDVLNKKFGKNFTILNPNEKMAKLLSSVENKSGIENIVVNRVLTRIKLKEYQINKLSKLLGKDSESVAIALNRYEHIPELFSI